MIVRALAASLSVAALLATGSASAQQKDTVAKLKDLRGTVLVSQGDAMAAGAGDQRLVVGTRVVTASDSGVTINYDRGCDVRLRENQRFTVREGECAALIASVESVAGGAVAAGGVSPLIGLAVIGGIATGLVLRDRHDDDRGRNVSPN